MNDIQVYLIVILLLVFHRRLTIMYQERNDGRKKKKKYNPYTDAPFLTRLRIAIENVTGFYWMETRKKKKR